MPRRTPVTHLLVSVASVVTTVLVTGCSWDPFVGPDLRGEAQALADSLEQMVAVTDVDMEYAEPIVLDSGKLALEVQMTRGAGPDEALAVVETVYAAFSTTHRDEEGDLDVALGDDRVHLRSFSPEAAADEVLEQATLALALADAGRLEAVVTADSVPRDPHVRTATRWRLPAGSSATDLPDALRVMRREHDHAGLEWTVAAADGAAVSDAGGVPGVTAEQRWRRLSAVPLAGARTAISYDETRDREGRVHSWVDVRVVGETASPLSLEDARTWLRMRRTAIRHVALMRRWSHTVSYRVLLEGREVLLADDGLGAFGTDRGKRLARELLAGAPRRTP